MRMSCFKYCERPAQLIMLMALEVTLGVGRLTNIEHPAHQ